MGGWIGGWVVGWLVGWVDMWVGRCGERCIQSAGDLVRRWLRVAAGCPGNSGGTDNWRAPANRGGVQQRAVTGRWAEPDMQLTGAVRYARVTDEPTRRYVLLAALYLPVIPLCLVRLSPHTYLIVGARWEGVSGPNWVIAHHKHVEGAREVHRIGVDQDALAALVCAAGWATAVWQ